MARRQKGYVIRFCPRCGHDLQAPGKPPARAMADNIYQPELGPVRVHLRDGRLLLAHLGRWTIEFHLPARATITYELARVHDATSLD